MAASSEGFFSKLLGSFPSKTPEPDKSVPPDTVLRVYKDIAGVSLEQWMRFAKANKAAAGWKAVEVPAKKPRAKTVVSADEKRFLFGARGTASRLTKEKK